MAKWSSTALSVRFFDNKRGAAADKNKQESLTGEVNINVHYDARVRRGDSSPMSLFSGPAPDIVGTGTRWSSEVSLDE